MNLDDLTAAELAAIDTVCLEFEECFDSERPLSVEQAIKAYIEQHAGTPLREHIELLREELLAIENELQTKRHRARQASESIPTPFQSKTGSDAPRQASRSQTPPDQTPHSSPSVKGPFAGQRPVSDAINLDPIDQKTPDTHWMAPPPGSPPPGFATPADADNDTKADGTPEVAEGAAHARAPRTRPDDESVSSIGPYAISRVLARGGMGIVYRALDTRLDRPVAIKMLGFPHLASSDPKRIELVERFEREAKAVAALSHPNIVELFDVGMAGSAPYAVMEFLSGLTLADQLAAGPMSPEQTCQIGMQIAGALATAHAAGVIHRDLKPQNVMLVDNHDSGNDSAPRVKLVDFGLSRVSDSAFPGDVQDAGRTRSGTILGTPGYMAPEQARGESATTAADMFGFGCVLYEVFYGKQAIPGATPADRLAGTLRGEVQYDRLPCEKSRVLCELIAQCLDKDPAKRPTATDVYARLRRFDINRSVSSAPDLAARPVCGSDPGEGLLRRHVLTTLAGGLLGGMFGSLTLGKATVNMGSIESIAVLSLRDVNASATEDSDGGMLLADRGLADGEILASALVNELSTVDGLTVLPYRPLTAQTPQQFVALGEELGVDAFLTGSYESQTSGQQKYWLVNWQLVSAVDGSVLDGKQFVTEQTVALPGGQFLAQSVVASDIAGQIGRALVTSGQKHNAPDPMAYGCLMRGHAYGDADCTKGLERAISCFEKAHEEDPRLSEPLAAIALASLNLAARSDTAESLAHLEKARTSMTKALEKDPSSVDARVAQAMIEWQSLDHYDEAYRLFAELHRQHRYNFQVQHQRGLLLAALGLGEQAIDALRTATKLNPMSMLIKTDKSRVDWFFQYDRRALVDAQRYRDSTPAGNPSAKLAIGLLIDIYEQQGDYQSAAEQQEFATVPTSSQEYFHLREATLAEFPYGPFGSSLNRAIFDLRTDADLDDGLLGRLSESGATMFPLLLAQHPAFFDLRVSPAAAPYLPSAKDITRTA
ncbi:Serine/threonine-protein kinase PK-1 [Stieleria maiorica]|uniref:Serine/threonine-protein kinase PK-1 n=1 Tax=Stieleria maiorica TaxID=2795974 RepID=A0A5B9MHL2_9BACT|nr:serine/threonine-protein kinase [Stieleria maiorica]QEF99546.1 Serine/threonine-protein kinase PK-1 [Stieleria maiorica]